MIMQACNEQEPHNLAPFWHSRCFRLSDQTVMTVYKLHRIALLDNAYMETTELYKALLGAMMPWWQMNIPRLAQHAQ